MLEIVKLADVHFRSNESRTIAHRLKTNSVAEDISGWTLELFADGSALKTITTASAAATEGQIKEQGSNPGEYFFTLLEADLVALLGSEDRLRVPCYIRYTSDETDPPRVFANVEFNLVIKRA